MFLKGMLERKYGEMFSFAPSTSASTAATLVPGVFVFSFVLVCRVGRDSSEGEKPLCSEEFPISTLCFNSRQLPPAHNRRLGVLEGIELEDDKDASGNGLAPVEACVLSERVSEGQDDGHFMKRCEPKLTASPLPALNRRDRSSADSGRRSPWE